jgi:hypothetical protein
MVSILQVKWKSLAELEDLKRQELKTSSTLALMD